MAEPTTIGALQEEVEAVAASLPGTLGAAILFLDDEGEVRTNGDEPFPAASVIKVPIMVEVYRQAEAGIISLDAPLVVRAQDMVGGSGLLQFLHPGLELTVRDAVELMITISDNTATNLVLDVVGHENVNRTMRALGLVDTVSAGPLMRGITPLSHTTPNDMAFLLARIARGEAVSPAASAAMMTTLEHQLYDDGLPRALPISSYPEGAEQAGVPLRVAHKTGSINGCRHDVGVLLCATPAGERRVAIAILTRDLEDSGLWTPENVGLRAIAALSRAAYDTQMALARDALHPKSLHLER